MRVGSLFAGIGGFDLGFERAGYDIAWQVEIDAYASRVLAKHWPGVKRYGDIRSIGAHNAERVDVVCGGFPCQDVSIAGLRAGISGKRSGLWSELARVLGDLRPGYVLVENVPGLLTGGGMGRVLGDLAAIGYDAEWDVLPAAAFGAPHLRARVWLLAYPVGLRDRTSCETIFAGRDQLRHGAGWATEPDVGRVAHGVPARVDRLRGLGNAVVPQIVEWIARRIKEADAEMRVA